MDHQQVSGADHLQHALPVQRLIQNSVDSIGRVSQRFRCISRNPVDHHAAVGWRVARGLEYTVRVRIIEPEHTRFKLLAVKELDWIPIRRHHADSELPEAVIQKGIAAGINVDARDPGSNLARDGCNGGTAHVSLRSVGLLGIHYLEAENSFLTLAEAT